MLLSFVVSYRFIKFGLPVAFLLIISQGLAQDEEKINSQRRAPRIEFFGGTNIVFPRIDSAYFAVKLKQKVGFTAGIGVQWPLAKRVQIDTKLLFERTAFEGYSSPPGYLAIRGFNINSDHTTVVCAPRFLIGGTAQLSLSPGGYISFLTRSKSSFGYPYGDPVPDQLRLETNLYNNIDAGISLGLGYHVLVNRHVFLNIQLLNRYGFRNILNDKEQLYDQPPLYYFNSSTVKNYTMSLVVGLSGILNKPDFSYSKNMIFNQSKSKPFFSEVQFITGPSISFLRGNVEVENTTLVTRKLKLGYTYGLGLTHRIDKNYEVKVHVLFERYGGVSLEKTNYFDEVSQAFKQGEVRRNYNYNYYTLPILVRHGVGSYFQIGLGSFISYLQKQTLTQSHHFNGTLVTSNTTGSNTKLNLGFSCEIACEVPINRRISVNIELLNNLGLLNIRPMITDGYTMKTNSTSLLAGIILKR